MGDVKYTIRKMTKEDAPQALDIWKETSMHQGTYSLFSWLEVDPEAFSIAVTDEGEVIGVCSAVIHHDDLAFVGLYCVRQKYRGLGVGLKVWNACMEHVGSRNVCLNAVPGKLKLYRDKGNFPVVETEWVCIVNETESPIHPEKLSDTLPSGVDVLPLQDAHLPLIFEYDRNLLGFDRHLALKLSSKEQDANTFVALRNGACAGFGIIKMSCQGQGQVGPLYADEKQIAEVILKRLISSLPQARGLAMMTCSCNGPANELMERIGCPATEECPRLYRKYKVEVDKNKVFAQFDLNFEPY